MARRRLSPANPDPLAAPAPSARPALAPIARVAGEAAATSALTEVTAALESARAEGRMIEALPLDAIDPGHLVRDRIGLDSEEMDVLKRSLAARGQQMPIDVVALEDGRYGLVSGWRRLTALGALLEETGEARFATVLARIVRPEDRAGSYLAMVEENEIRSGLSFYERARIVWKSQEDGAYPDRRAALRGLFGNVPRARRSKIGSFVTLVETFDNDLRFPTAISEKLGLKLVKALDADRRLAGRIRKRLAKTAPQTAEAEQAILTSALTAPRTAEESGPLSMRFDPKRRRIEITGTKVTPDLYHALHDWLGERLA